MTRNAREIVNVLAPGVALVVISLLLVPAWPIAALEYAASPVGFGRSFVGELHHPIAPLHSEGLHYLLRWPTEGLLGSDVGSLALSLSLSAILVTLLGVLCARRLGGPGRVAPWLLIASPGFFLFAAAPTHETLAIIGLLAAWSALERGDTGLGNKLVFSVGLFVAALSDVGGIAGVLLIALYLSWRDDWYRWVWSPLAAAIAATALAYYNVGDAGLLATLDARFVLGFDHLIRAGGMLAYLLPWFWLGPLWLIIYSVRRLRRPARPLAGLAGIFVVVGLFELILVREPSYASNTLWLAVAIPLVIAIVGHELAPRWRTQSFVAGLVLLVGIGVVTSAASWARWSASEWLHFAEGTRTAVVDEDVRLLSEALPPGSEPLYLGPDVPCSSSCFGLGRDKVALGAWPSSAPEGALSIRRLSGERPPADWGEPRLVLGDFGLARAGSSPQRRRLKSPDPKAPLLRDLLQSPAQRLRMSTTRRGSSSRE